MSSTIKDKKGGFVMDCPKCGKKNRLTNRKKEMWQEANCDSCSEPLVRDGKVIKK